MKNLLQNLLFVSVLLCACCTFQQTSEGQIFISEEILEKNSVYLETMQGTCINGRLTEIRVLVYIANRPGQQCRYCLDQGTEVIGTNGQPTGQIIWNTVSCTTWQNQTLAVVDVTVNPPPQGSLFRGRIECRPAGLEGGPITVVFTTSTVTITCTSTNPNSRPIGGIFQTPYRRATNQ